MKPADVVPRLGGVRVHGRFRHQLPKCADGLFVRLLREVRVTEFVESAAGQHVELGHYLYWLNQQDATGDKVWWTQEMPLDKWVCVEGRVSMNTPGESDG